jgi:hypothetical protein
LDLKFLIYIRKILNLTPVDPSPPPLTFDPSTPLNLSKEFNIWSPARILEQESSTSQIQIQNVNNNRRLLPQFNQLQMKSSESSLLRKIKKENEAKDEQQKIFPVSENSFFLDLS